MADENDPMTPDDALRQLEEELRSPEMKDADSQQMQNLRKYLDKGVREHRRILALSRERASRQVRQ